MTLQGTNTYLIGTGVNRILLDTGDPDKPLFIENLKNVLHSEKASIETILLTHWHHDHIGGVRDVLSILDANADCKVWKYPRVDAADVYEEIPKSVELNKLTDGQEFTVDGASVKVIYTPGHTTDHVVLQMKDDKTLFSGDCILGEGTAVFEDLYDYMRSLQLILDNKPTKIYPGHGNIVDDPIPKIQFYIDHRNQREAQILNALKSHPERCFTEMDLVEIIYQETPKELWPAAAYNVRQHLTKLTKERQVVELTKDGVTVWQYRQISAL
ncbi:hypothetical protein HA402_006277 [Bradysia odoriphaga]|nr:hypothetical protein HA402_006277 [Bradysia odoriphaga]